MSSEKAEWQSNESLPVPAYTIVELSTPTELEDAVAFDTAIFSENRHQYEGEDVAQPTVDISEYEHLVENGGRVIAFLDNTNNEMIALCTVALKNDPEALESLLQTMQPDTAYMTVAGVKKEYRGQGLGHKMLQARLEIARQAGKTKAITTVHPTNIASMKNLLKAGFLGIARIDNYYNMHDTDGERFVMFHGDINNVNWAEESLNHSVTLATPYTKTAEISRLKYNMETILDFKTREHGYSLYAAEHTSKDVPTYHWAKFIGNDKPPIPSLIYPYNSFAEAYAITRNFDPSQKPRRQPVSDTLAHASMKFVDFNYGEYAQRYDLKALPVMEAVTKKFFFEWVNEYRSFVQKSIDTLEPTTFAPSFDTATIMSRQIIEELVLLFLANENDNLWDYIDNCLPDLRKNLTLQGIEPPYTGGTFKHPQIETLTLRGLRILYSEQNALLHQHINAYYQDLVAALPWPQNKEGYMKLRKRLYHLVGKEAFNLSNLHWS